VPVSLVVVLLGVAALLIRAVPAVIALIRADRKDIPAIVRAMARWWRK
jgi:hypothetical protein